MTSRPVCFRQIDTPKEATSEVSRELQIVDTFGFEIIEQTSPVAPANVNDPRDAPLPELRTIDVVPFAATLRRIA